MQRRAFLIGLGIGGMVGLVIGIICYILGYYALGAFEKDPQGLDSYLQASITIVALLMSVGSLIFVEIVRALTIIPTEARKLLRNVILNQLNLADRKTVERIVTENNEFIAVQNSQVDKVGGYIRNMNYMALGLFASGGLCIISNMRLFIAMPSILSLALSFALLTVVSVFLIGILQYYFSIMLTNAKYLKIRPMNPEDYT